MKLKVLLIVAAILTPIVAQEAKILIVEKPDSQKLARAYREYKDAARHWEEVKAEVAKQYTTEGGKPMAGWEKVEFSADFRAIVPKESRYVTTGAVWGPCSSTGTLVPNWGTTLSGTGNLVNLGATTNIGAAGTSAVLSGDLDIDQSLVVKEKKLSSQAACVGQRDGYAISMECPKEK